MPAWARYWLSIGGFGGWVSAALGHKLFGLHVSPALASACALVAFFGALAAFLDERDG